MADISMTEVPRDLYWNGKFSVAKWLDKRAGGIVIVVVVVVVV